MDTTQLYQLAAYTIPALVAGGVAYVVINRFLNNEDSRRRYELIKENQKQALPIRLQAYERVVLFLERINPVQLLLRVPPNELDPQSYATLLVHSIQTEYEHNITQQIYITSEGWETVLKAKNAIITLVRNKSITEGISNANEMRKAILEDVSTEEVATDLAIALLKEELKKVF